MSRALNVSVLIACAVAGAVVMASWQGIVIEDLKHFGTPRNSVIEGDTERTIPLPDGPAMRRSAVIVPETSGSFAFLFDDVSEGPVRYDPCRPVKWVLSPAGMPRGALPMLHNAADAVAAASGIDLVYEGTTNEPASFERELLQPQYGEGFAPVVVGWSTESQNPDLAGAVSGVGGSSAVNGAYGEQRYLRAGVMVLDSEDLRQLAVAPGGEARATAIIMHEWGHVLGLAHVQDPNELMNASSSTLTTWGPGDLAGLAIAGAGPCEDV
ncbi:matrixin family metalloprotease [Demequina oxidasica]|uniref:matrixin family metalloprotease n=1 Tax=Demequina oxidasica TaxID=676199 RepID=UPI000782CFEA|nr:matrixin family metalloprotease [Demequina oxidasica]